MRAPTPSSVLDGVRRFLDPFAATTAAAVAYSCLLVASAEGGRVLELLLLAAAAIAAHGHARVAPAWATAAAGLGYLAVELTEGRLTYDYYWRHILAVALLGIAVFGAAAARRARDEQLAETAAAIASGAELRVEDDFELLLAGGRPRTAIERELLRSKRHDHAAGMLLIRPDRIEQATDEDAMAVARSVAAEVGLELRTSDVAFHHGRFDICVLLPETEPAGARAAAERIRLALVDRGAPAVSIGAATFPSATSQELLLADAREALERARQLGGNRTVASSLPVSTPPGWTVSDPRPEGSGDAPTVTRFRDST